MPQICRWGIRSSQAANSLSNVHDTRVHNQEFRFSLGSYNPPAKLQEKQQMAYVRSERQAIRKKCASNLNKERDVRFKLFNKE